MLERMLQSLRRKPPPQLPPKPRLAGLPDVQPAEVPATFPERQQRASAVEGMMSEFSMQAMDTILAFQSELGIRGPVFEAGVWKGRSSSILSAHVREDEQLILSDVSQLLTAEVLSTAIYVRPVFIIGPSKEFGNHFDLAEIRGKVRFAHIDSSHSYRDTLAEMALLDEILAPDGVACLDDYANLNYSQILPAVFKYIYTSGTDLVLFMVTNDKGYLCRRSLFPTYGAFVLENMIHEMGARGNSDVILSRTDADEEYRAFYLRPRAPGESGTFYGTELYAEFYKVP